MLFAKKIAALTIGWKTAFREEKKFFLLAVFNWSSIFNPESSTRLWRVVLHCLMFDLHSSAFVPVQIRDWRNCSLPCRFIFERRKERRTWRHSSRVLFGDNRLFFWKRIFILRNRFQESTFCTFLNKLYHISIASNISISSLKHIGRDMSGFFSIHLMSDIQYVVFEKKCCRWSFEL